VEGKEQWGGRVSRSGAARAGEAAAWRSLAIWETSGGGKGINGDEGRRGMLRRNRDFFFFVFLYFVFMVGVSLYSLCVSRE
jgi:hypothetical protein